MFDSLDEFWWGNAQVAEEQVRCRSASIGLGNSHLGTPLAQNNKGHRNPPMDDIFKQRHELALQLHLVREKKESKKDDHVQSRSSLSHVRIGA